MSVKPAPAHAQPAATPAALPLSSRPPRVEVIALTDDDALLEQIGQGLDGESTIRPVDSVDSAREFIRPARPCVLLLDARGQAELGAIVERLQSPDGTCIVVVLAPADASASVSKALRGSATFAVLPIPIQPDQTRAVLEGARDEALARCTLAAPSSSNGVVSSAPATEPAIAPIAIRPVAAPPKLVNREPATRSRKTIAAGGNKPRAKFAIVATVALIAVAAAWFTLRGPSPVARKPAAAAAFDPPAQLATPAPASAANANAVPAGSIDELLDKARAALGDRHYTEPEGANALAYLSAVLAQDPANDEAREGMQRIATLLDERLQSELAQRKFGDAASTLAQLRLMQPGSPALAQFEARLAEAQTAAARDAERQQGNVRAQQLAQLVATRIRENKLVDPANDSAKAYLAQLRGLPADPKGLGDAAAANLKQAYLLKIREAAAQSQRAELNRWVAEARALGVDPSRLAAAMRAAPPVTPAAATVNPQSARLVQLVQERIRDGHLLEPAQDSAVAYLNALRNQDPSGSETTASTRMLSDALLEGGRSALSGRNFDAAQLNASAARRLGLDVDDVDALDRAIAAARAAAAPPLKRTHFVPPEYPKGALKDGLEGEVRVQITVAANGKVKSVTVVNSSPARVFDEAALDAVRRWRFKPLSDDDPNLEATAMADIVFQPKAVNKP